MTEISNVEILQTAIAKSRGFIRASLNAGGNTLENVIVHITQNKQLLSFFYNDNALLRQSQDVSVLV